MPILPRSRSRESLAWLAAEELLNGRGAGSGAPAGQQALARVLAVAGGPASDCELAGQAAVMAAFAAATGPAAQPRQPRQPGPAARHRRSLRSHLTTRLVVAAAACVTALGGAAAYASALPAPLQDLAHATFGAPAPRQTAPRPHVTSASPGHQGQRAGRAHRQPGHQKVSLEGGAGQRGAGHRKSHRSGPAHPKTHQPGPHQRRPSPRSHPTRPPGGPHVPGPRA